TGGSDSHPPRRVQVFPGGDPGEEVAARVEDADEAAAMARELVLRVLVLPGVGDIDLAPEVLDAERGVMLVELRIDEGPRHVHRLEAAVENVHAPVVEVGGVEEVAGGRARDREPLVDGAGGGDGDDGLLRGRRHRRRYPRVPARDRAVLA